MFEIQLRREVIKSDLPKIDALWQKKIKLAIQSRLTIRPQIYGKPLRKTLKDYRKLRVGDYRVIFTIEGGVVKIFAVGHRSTVYKEIIKRL